MSHQSSTISNSRFGFTLLETLISITIFSIFIVFFIASFRQIFSAQDISWERIDASFYAQEGMEVVYNVFENIDNWQALANSFTPNQSYWVNEESSTYLSLGSQEIEGYTREIFISPVYRNAQLEIVSAEVPGAVLDTQIVQIESIVTWESRGQDQEVRFVTYLTQPAPEKIF